VRCAALVALAISLAAAVPADARRAVPQGFYGAVWDAGLARSSPGTRERQWALMARSGVESVRTVFSWDEAQPSPDAPPSFVATDRLVALAARHRMQLVPVVLWTPAWARRDPSLYNSPPVDPGPYAAYLRALVGRYGPAGSFWAEHPELPRAPLRTWQIWNEPQLQLEWNAPGWQRGYGELLRASRDAIRAADPGATVVLGAVVNVAWDALDELYREGGIAGAFDVVAVHPYTSSAGRVLEVVRRVRAVMRRRGDARMPIWITELGWPAARGTEGRPPRGLRTIVTDDRGMAERLRSAYTLLARHRRDRRTGATRAFWFRWASPYRGRDVFDYTGLMRVRGSRFESRPALRAYRAIARRHEGCVKTGVGRCR
jgi:hypothetical protein